MKNLGMISYAALAATILAGTALADGDKTNKFKPFYVKASTGFSMLFIKTLDDDKTNNNSKKSNNLSGRGITAVFSAGYHFTENFATELDLGIYYVNKTYHSDTKYSIFANCQYNFATTSQFSPYIKAGLGYQHLIIGLWTANLPTAAVGVGVTYNTSSNMFLDIGYTFSMSMKSKTKRAGGIDSGEKASLTGHNIAISAGFRF